MIYKSTHKIFFSIFGGVFKLIPNATFKTFASLFDLMRAFPTEEGCICHLEGLRWKTGDSEIYKCKDHKYKCRLSNRYFSVRTQTMFEGSKVPLQKWFYPIYVVSGHMKGISSHQLARDLHITQKSAWFILYRIRKAMGNNLFHTKLTGVVEADETFVGGKNINRHWDKKVEKAHGRSYKDKTPVFGLLQRNGLLFAQVVANTKSATIQPLVHSNVEHGSVLMTDEWAAYRGMGRYYDHRIVEHSMKIYASGEVYTNTLEGAWSWLKRMIMGIYHKCSRKHLQMYVNEFVFKYNTRKFNDGYRFNGLLDCSFSSRLMYKELINAT